MPTKKKEQCGEMMGKGKHTTGLIPMTKKHEKTIKDMYKGMKPEHRLRHRISLLHDRPMKPAHKMVVNLASHLLKQEEIHGNGFWLYDAMKSLKGVPFAAEILTMIHPALGYAYEGAKMLDEGDDYNERLSHTNSKIRQRNAAINNQRIRESARSEKLKMAERKRESRAKTESIKDRYLKPEYAHLVGTKGFEHAQVRPAIRLTRGGDLFDNYRRYIDSVNEKEKEEAKEEAKSQMSAYPPPSSVNYPLPPVNYIEPPEKDWKDKVYEFNQFGNKESPWYTERVQEYNKRKADYLKKKEIEYAQIYAKSGEKNPGSNPSPEVKLMMVKDILDAPESSRPVMWMEYRDEFNYDNPYESQEYRDKTYAKTPEEEYRKIMRKNPNLVLPESKKEKQTRLQKEEDDKESAKLAELNKAYEDPDLATGLDDLVNRISQATDYDAVPPGELEPMLRFPIMYNYDQNSRPMPLTEWLISSGVSGQQFSTKEFGNTYMNQKPYAFLDMPINGGRLGKIDYSKLAYSPF